MARQKQQRPSSSKLAGKKIVPLVKTNPRREGTLGFKSFSLIRRGMTYEAYIAAGGRNKDLRWDLKHGYVRVA